MDFSLHRLDVTFTRSATWGFAPQDTQKLIQKKKKKKNMQNWKLKYKQLVIDVLARKADGM